MVVQSGQISETLKGTGFGRCSIPLSSNLHSLENSKYLYREYFISHHIMVDFATTCAARFWSISLNFRPIFLTRGIQNPRDSHETLIDVMVIQVFDL